MMAQTLAERHTNQLMGLFRKAAAVTGTSGAASPINAGFPSGVSAQDIAASNSGSMRRTPSGSGNRPSSPTSIRRDSPLPRPDTITSGAGTPLKTSLTAVRPPLFSRSATPTVLNQNPASATSQNLSSLPSKRPKSPILPRHRLSTLQLSTTTRSPRPQSPEHPLSSPAKSSTSSSSSSSSSPVESRIIKRPSRHPKPAPSTSLFPNPDDEEEEEEEEAEPAFLPYRSPQPAAAAAASAGSSDLGATLRGALPSSSSRRPPAASKGPTTTGLPSSSSRDGSELKESQTSDSSNSSAAAAAARSGHPVPGGRGRGEGIGPPLLLSPRRTAELAGKGKGKLGRDGSDGTPSMGSSFSDLDGE